MIPCVSDISEGDARYGVANGFCNQVHGLDRNVKSDVAEAMVSHVSACSEAELRDLALRLVEHVATGGTEFWSWAVRGVHGALGSATEHSQPEARRLRRPPSGLPSELMYSGIFSMTVAKSRLPLSVS